MKKHLFTLLLLTSIKIWSQDNIQNDHQKENFESAKNTFENGDYLVAARQFSLVYNINPKSEIAQIAIKKADSIKSIFRKNKISRLIGNWKWIYKEANWAIREDNLVGKMITINPNEILFFELYKNSKNWKLVKKETIKFSEKLELYSFTELVYSNKEIWDYSIDDNSGELKAYYIGEETEEGLSEMVCGNPVFYYFKLQ
jgi:hypothetical protein